MRLGCVCLRQFLKRDGDIRLAAAGQRELFGQQPEVASLLVDFDLAGDGFELKLAVGGFVLHHKTILLDGDFDVLVIDLDDEQTLVGGEADDGPAEEVAERQQQQGDGGSGRGTMGGRRRPNTETREPA